MKYYKIITTINLGLLLISCSRLKKGQHPYRPSGKSKSITQSEAPGKRQRVSVDFLRDRYNLCTHKRVLRSARLKYQDILNREKRYGNNLNSEKLRYRKIIFDVGSRTKEEEIKFTKKYKRRLYCSRKEMRAISI